MAGLWRGPEVRAICERGFFVLNEQAPSRTKSPFTNKPTVFIRCAMHILCIEFPDGTIPPSVKVSKTNRWLVRGPSINLPNTSLTCHGSCWSGPRSPTDCKFSAMTVTSRLGRMQDYLCHQPAFAGSLERLQEPWASL